MYCAWIKRSIFIFLIDVSRCKLWFYYVDLDTKEKVLLKTYPVSLGRIDSAKLSGLLTPLGKYILGSKMAIYKPNLRDSSRKKDGNDPCFWYPLDPF